MENNEKNDIYSLVLPTPPKFVYDFRKEELTKWIKKQLEDPKLQNINPESPISYFATDSYYLHYNFYPEVIKDPVKDSTKELMRQILKLHLDSDEFKRVHPLTRYNEFLSKVNTIQLVKYFLEELKKKQKQEESNNKNKNPRDSGLAQFLKMLVNGSLNSPNIKLPNLSQEDIKIIQNALRKAQKKAEEDTKKAKELVYGWGLEPSIPKVLDAIKTLKTRKAEEILKYLKHLERMSQFYRTKYTKGVIGSEFAEFDQTRIPQYADYLEVGMAMFNDSYWAIKSIMGFRRTLKKTPQKPALIVLIDSSGSMEGIKDIWARSVALALLKKARTQKMKTWMALFSDITEDFISEPKTQIKIALTRFLHGGTNIYRAINKALDLALSEGIKNVNIVVITDEQARANYSQLLPKIRKVKADLFIVNIGGYSNESLRKIAKKVFQVQTTTDDALKVISII